jgi:hypothetical protein
MYSQSEDQSFEAFMQVWAGDHLLDSELHEKGVKQAQA